MSEATMWSIPTDEPERSSSSNPDCPGCGAPDLHGDDFCHECGHGFDHLRRSEPGEDHERTPCPMCPSGDLAQLEYGRTQCDSCGYTVRDEG